VQSYRIWATTHQQASSMHTGLALLFPSSYAGGNYRNPLARVSTAADFLLLVSQAPCNEHPRYYDRKPLLQAQFLQRIAAIAPQPLDPEQHLIVHFAVP